MPRSLPCLLVLTFVAVLSAACGSAPSGSPPTPAPTGSQAASPTAAASVAPTSVGSPPSPVGSPPTEASPPTSVGSPSPPSVASPSPTSVVYQSPGDLVVGDCFDPIDDSDDDTLLAAVIRACAEPHIREVFGLLDLPDGPEAPYPGDAEVNAAAEELCDTAFEAYVGIPFDDSRFGYFYYTPDREAWLGGDRSVLCVIDDEGEPLTGSVRDSRQ